MTIRPGEEWGQLVQRPDGLRVVTSDADVVDAVQSGTPVAVAGGDLHRTVGSRDAEQVAALEQLLALPIDLLHVRLDDGTEHIAAAHVLARRPGRLGWWRGELFAAMNAQFVGDWDLAPRSHPNDGRVDVTSCPPSFGLRQRLAARSRLSVGGHLPHPLLTTSVVTARQARRVEFGRRLTVFVDGRPVGASRSIELSVEPDAATIHA